VTQPLRASIARPLPWPRGLFTLVADQPFSSSLEPTHLREALARAMAEHAPGVVGLVVHQFEPQGVSLIALGPALRSVLHSWPEHGRATLDVSAPTAEIGARVALRISELLALELRAE